MGIDDGDLVIAEKTPVARNGEIVVAMIEDEATVKTFYKENGHFRLQPENDTYEPIIVNEVSILGKVVAVIRCTIDLGTAGAGVLCPHWFVFLVACSTDLSISRPRISTASILLHHPHEEAAPGCRDKARGQRPPW